VEYVNAISDITVAQDRAARRRTTKSNLEFLAMLAVLAALMVWLAVQLVRLVVVLVKGLPLLGLAVIRLLQAVVWVLFWTYAVGKLGFLLITRQRTLAGLGSALRNGRLHP
jgi:hypothetical protein